MSDSRRDARPRRGAVPNAGVSHYETLPLNQVREELRMAGIDPAPTIAVVKKLVEDSLAKSKRPRAAPTTTRPHKAPSQRLRSFVTAAYRDNGNEDDF